MDDRYRRLARAAAPNDGLFLRATARAVGFPDSSITEHVRTGRWEVRFGHVLSPAGLAPSWRRQLRAAALRLGADAVVAGRSAARLWELTGFEQTEALELRVPREHTPRLPGVTVARGPVPAGTVVDLAGFRSEDATTTLRSLARRVDEARLLRAAAEAYRRGRTDPAALMRLVLDHPGTTGNPRLSAVARTLDPRMGRARSVAETDAIATLVAIGVEDFEVNVRRRLGCGRRVELDLLLDGRGVLEVDGERYHGDVLARRRDARRHRDIRADGYPLVVLPARHARDPVAVRAAVDELRSLYAH